jgi:lipid A 3-O-deacylase
MTRIRLIGFLTSLQTASLVVGAAVSGEPAPEKNWEIAYESGALWRVGGGGSQLDYVLLPQLLTWRTPEVTRWFVGGRDLIMRSRFSVLAEPFAKGPESCFLGGSAGGLLEWWNHQRTQALFFSGGGGVGWMDSKGYEIDGAQGQDFNFHWFAYAGSRFQWRGGVSASAGVYFQHVSNTGLDDVNPGIDACGPMVTVGWRF